MTLGLGPSEEEEPDTNDTGDGEEPPEGWRTSPKGLERLDLVNSYIADEDDWPAKTILGIGDPARVAALSVFDRLFPSVSHQQDIREQFVLLWMKSRTSRAIKTDEGLQGQSRKDYKELLMATFGQHKDEDKAGQFFDALAADLYEDD